MICLRQNHTKFTIGTRPKTDRRTQHVTGEQMRLETGIIQNHMKSNPHVSSKSSENGWCGTCYQGDLNPGQEGYCDKYKADTELGTDEEMGRPTHDKNWAWCRSTCQDVRPNLSKSLQETKLDLLTPEQCEDLGSAMETNGTTEICAGRKNLYPKV